jgi:DNA repair photolyase
MTTVVLNDKSWFRKRIIYEPRGRAFEYAPLAVSLYHGYSHGYVYCYVPAALKTDKDHFLKPYVRKDALIKLEKDAADLAKHKDTREILMSFTTDPYQPIEEEIGITRKAIEILIKYGLDFTVLTKNGLLSTRDFDLMAAHPELCRYGTTLTFTNPDDRINFEPNASPTEHRIAALQIAHKKGIRTWVSIEPVIDPDQSLELIKRTVGFVDEYRIGKLNHMNGYEINETDMITFINESRRVLDLNGNDYIYKKDVFPYIQKSDNPTYKMIKGVR